MQKLRLTGDMFRPTELSGLILPPRDDCIRDLTLDR